MLTSNLNIVFSLLLAGKKIIKATASNRVKPGSQTLGTNAKIQSYNTDFHLLSKVLT
jgi:hypothetical protein